MSGKFRDKETGVEGYLRANREIEYQIEDERGMPINGSFKTLSELLEKWEEIDEEPKKYWFIAGRGVVEHALDTGDENDPFDKGHKEMGNYFETEEEAEKVVEKLKAWKRLKDKGFRFAGYTDDSGDLFSCQVIRCRFDDFGKESRKDLDLLFGGEDE